ncbi:MAG: zinc-dependent alcohol dehydrogenase [Bacillota bacterium]
MSKMRAVVFTGPEELEIRKLDIPEPGPGEALINVKSCNICTTEQGQYLGKRSLKYPYIGGHEFGGVIEKIGPNSGSKLEVGDHAACGYDFCGKCWYCRSGIYTNCHILYEDDIRYEKYYGMFGLADYIVMPLKTIYKFDKSLSFEEIGFEEPLGTVIHGQRRININPGDTVVIFGAGTMGMLNMMLANLSGAVSIVIDIKEDRLEKAKELGCDYTINSSKENLKRTVGNITDNRGADHVIIAVGNTEVNNQSLEIVRHKGNILFFAAGYPEPEIDVDPNYIHYTEAALVGTYGGDPADFQRASELINSKKINVKPLLDKKYSVDSAEEAFKRATSGKAYRVTINF